MTDDVMADLPLVLTPVVHTDLPQIDRLDERCFGPGRFARTAYRLREGVSPLFELSRVARIGSFLVGANIMTPILCDKQPALLLGPLTVEPAFRARKIGEALVQASLKASRAAGHELVILVGDEPYYQRMGFVRAPKGQFFLPGPVDPDRILYCELVPNALARMRGSLRRMGG